MPANPVRMDGLAQADHLAIPVANVNLAGLAQAACAIFSAKRTSSQLTTDCSANPASLGEHRRTVHFVSAVETSNL